MSMQKVTIIGNLGRDPEMRFTPNGQAVTNLSVATNRTYEKDGEQVKETTWFRVSAWGKQAEACNQYLKKGSLVYVEGRLNVDAATGGPRVFESKNSESGFGASFEVVANTVQFLDKRGEQTEEEESKEVAF